MNLKNKNGFITVYVLISMIFLIAIITISLISASRKMRNQAQINSEIFKIYNQEDIKDKIVNYSTEIPIYTKEQFVYLKNWINDSNREKIYMQINENFYLLDPNVLNDQTYIASLKTNLHFETKSEIENIEIKKNNFNIYYYIPQSEKWFNRGFEVAKEPLYVQYDKEYLNLSLDVSGRIGYVLKINSNGGLYNSFEAATDLEGQDISTENIDFYIDNNYAGVAANFMSYYVEGENSFIGIKFKEGGIADVYWSDTGLITDITGLTPIGTISIDE